MDLLMCPMKRHWGLSSVRESRLPRILIRMGIEMTMPPLGRRDSVAFA